MPRLLVTLRSGAQASVEAAAGRRLMEVLRDEELDVEAICGGMQSCATCHVYVATEWSARLPPPAPGELELLQATPAYRPGASRLSCQVVVTKALDGLALTVAPGV